MTARPALRGYVCGINGGDGTSEYTPCQTHPSMCIKYATKQLKKNTQLLGMDHSSGLQLSNTVHSTAWGLAVRSLSAAPPLVGPETPRRSGEALSGRPRPTHRQVCKRNRPLARPPGPSWCPREGDRSQAAHRDTGAATHSLPPRLAPALEHKRFNSFNHRVRTGALDRSSQLPEPCSRALCHPFST